MGQDKIDGIAFFMAFQSMVKQAVAEAMAERDGPAPATAQSEAKPPATRKEAAKFLNISLPTLDTLIKTEQIKAFTIGRAVRIPWDALEGFLGGRAQ